MAKTRTPRKPRTPKKKPHDFRDRLILNQWLINLFGLDPLHIDKEGHRSVRPFHILAEPLKSAQEGLDENNTHYFYQALISSNLFWNDFTQVTKEQLLTYDENIVRHTQQINEKRADPIAWKYFQWLSLVFIEIYLDRFFQNNHALCEELNRYVQRFNDHYSTYEALPLYELDDLNKLCLQNATGSGKTLLMHVNLLQYLDYLEKYKKITDFNQIILITPNESLSDQHRSAFAESGIYADLGELFKFKGLDFQILEITKLGEKEGDKVKATASYGDQNLLLVDEGHRGLSGKEEGVWLQRRNQLSAKGFTFEYSATFEQAVTASGSNDIKESYSKAIIFDYAYRWFYEDGYGKDYQILNLPESTENWDQFKILYLTACLLKYYQQLRIYQDKRHHFKEFNPEKPLWVFVGNTVSKTNGKNDEKATTSDIAQIIHFIVDFLSHPTITQGRIKELLTGTGESTGLLDENGVDIFDSAFLYLHHCLASGETAVTLYQDILKRLFNHAPGGQLVLKRIKGDSGEIVLSVGTAETPFGLINVGDAKGLCDHLTEIADPNHSQLSVEDSNFGQALFASVKDSQSDINLLIGSKKFVEGWDCWRVSTMGLMRVGKSEGSQIIQLFGRGVRLKGYGKGLKRATHVRGVSTSNELAELETLNIFGVEAYFMEKFRDFLEAEGLPGNEQKHTFTIPLQLNPGLEKNLQILQIKKQKSNGHEYDFKKDAPVPNLTAEIPDYILRSPITIDWYPRIKIVQSKQSETTNRNKATATITANHLALVNSDALYFELERHKREKHWHNLNLSKEGISEVLEKSDWYILYLPEYRHEIKSFEDVLLWQQITTALMKRYLDRLYNYRKREYYETRLELSTLKREHNNIPQEDFYTITVDSKDSHLETSITSFIQDILNSQAQFDSRNGLAACHLPNHLFSPVLHLTGGTKMTITPLTLNDSEYQFVTDLKNWSDQNLEHLQQEKIELYLLRNLSRGKGMGFFEASSFHPDFLLWLIQGQKQSLNFIEPHGLMHEAPGSDKIKFHQTIKAIEARLSNRNITLNSFILSWTPYPSLQWNLDQLELESENVYFMKNDSEYLIKVITKIKENISQSG